MALINIKLNLILISYAISKVKFFVYYFCWFSDSLLSDVYFCFSCSAVNQRTNELTYSNMQIIAREVELQTMRRSAPKNTNPNTNTSKPNVSQKPKPQNHLQKLNTKGVAPKARTKDLVCIEFSYFSFYNSTWHANEKIHKSCIMIMTKLKIIHFALEIMNFNFVCW